MYTRGSWGASEGTLKSAKTSWHSQNKKINQLTKEEMGWLQFNWGRPPLCSSCLEACRLESLRCLYDKEQRERICAQPIHMCPREQNTVDSATLTWARNTSGILGVVTLPILSLISSSRFLLVLCSWMYLYKLPHL